MLDFGEPLFELYRSHDVFVLPSLSEGTPRTLVEARSFGCPVVATRAGGIPSSVEHGRDGLLVEPNDLARTSAASIARVLDDEPYGVDLIHEGLKTRPGNPGILCRPIGRRIEDSGKAGGIGATPRLHAS